jgi:glycosyltransferase involved in cell wall biosynthesis
MSSGPSQHELGIEYGAVVIGRNEGERLKRCLRSLSSAAVVIYVDSGSTDESVQHAREKGINVVELDLHYPFTAARARNVGFRHLRQIAAQIAYVQFVDGDCEVRPQWPLCALRFLEANENVAVVCGRTRERHPEHSVYNWLCDREWDGPVGEVAACGGIAMMRVGAVEAVGGYRDSMIAGEEPELCFRLRAARWRIWRLPDEMTLHDAAMVRFSQWWRRTMRGGYAFAEGSYLHGQAPERHWVWEARRAWIWGVWLPLICLAAGVAIGSYAWLLSLVYPFQVIRQVIRNSGSISDRTTLALFQVLARFPEAWGQIKFTRDRLFGREGRLIEYR